jgi:hypothetical protein
MGFCVDLTFPVILKLVIIPSRVSLLSLELLSQTQFEGSLKPCDPYTNNAWNTRHHDSRLKNLQTSNTVWPMRNNQCGWRGCDGWGCPGPIALAQWDPADEIVRMRVILIPGNCHGLRLCRPSTKKQKIQEMQSGGLCWSCQITYFRPILYAAVLVTRTPIRFIDRGRSH